MLTKYFQKLQIISRDAWLCLVTWALMGFAYSGIFLVMFNLYLLRLQCELEFVGLVNGVGLIAMAIFSLPAGTLGKRWGSRRMMIIGMGLMTAGFGALPFAEFVPAAWQAVMAGVMWMGNGIGGSFIVIMGSRVITTYGYDIFFLTSALLTALGGLIFIGYFRKPRSNFSRSSAQEPAD